MFGDICDMCTSEIGAKTFLECVFDQDNTKIIILDVTIFFEKMLFESVCVVG